MALKAYFYVILCVISWALIPVCSENILKGMNNFSMLLFSNLISTLTLGAYLFLNKKTAVLKRYNLKEFAYMSFLGFLGAFIYFVFLYGAFGIAPAQEVFIINYLWPILVVVLAVLILKEQLTVIKIISIFISFAGVVVIVTKGHPLYTDFGNIKGDVLAFLAALSFALFSVLGKKVKYDETVSVFVYFLSSFIFSVILIPLCKTEFINTSILFWLFINGVFVNGISYLFWFSALKKGNIHIVSNVVYLTPFVGLLFINVFLSKKIYSYSFIALILIISGILLQVSSKYVKKKEVI